MRPNKQVLLLTSLVRLMMVKLKPYKVKNRANKKELLKLRKESSRRVELRRMRLSPMLRARRQLKKVKRLISKTRISSLERKMKRMNSNPSPVSVREVFKLFSQLRMTRKLNSRKLHLKIIITQPKILTDISTCLLKRIT